MAHRAKSPDDYVPFRIAEQSYRRSPRPEYAALAHDAGWAVAEVMVRRALLNARGRPIKPVRMDVEQVHDPEAPRAYMVHGLTVRHPMRVSPDVDYWGLPLAGFESAGLVEPENLAIACVDALRKTFTGSALWEPKTHVFHSAEPPISYYDLGNMLEEEAAMRPAMPLDANKFTDYAARVGNRALQLATGSQDTGGVQLFPHTYLFVPKAQSLRLQD